MKLDYNITVADYKKSYFESLKKHSWKFIPLILVCIFIFFILIKDTNESNKIINYTIILLICSYVFIKFISNFYKVLKIFNQIEINQAYTGNKSIEIENDGIIYGINNTKYLWKDIKQVDELKNYIILYLKNNTSIIICKAGLNQNELTNFINKINDILNIINSPINLKKIKDFYWIGFLVGFIPVFGGITGAFIVFKGFEFKDRKLKILGIANMLFTFLFWLLVVKIKILKKIDYLIF